MVKDNVELSDCCRLTFQASSVGRRRSFGLVLTPTVAPGLGRSPLEGGAGKQLFAALHAGGPCVRVNRVDVAVLSLVPCGAWSARTGRFWVTTWPKIEPKIPRSKLRPYPARITVLGVA